jgi:hypothetical protein
MSYDNRGDFTRTNIGRAELEEEAWAIILI